MYEIISDYDDKEDDDNDDDDKEEKFQLWRAERVFFKKKILSTIIQGS